jgi:poly(3-hydroxybutyrate) depolymerase
MIYEQKGRSFSSPFQTVLESDLFSYQEMTTLYYMRDGQDYVSSPFNFMSDMARTMTQSPFYPLSQTSSGRGVSALFEMVERSTHRYRKPSFGIHSVVSSTGQVYEISPQVALQKDFCTLLHFERRPLGFDQKADTAESGSPRVLVVAPYSGHYATLLRDTVSSLLKDHEVWITDWENARDVPMTRGIFTLEHYIDYLMAFMRYLGPRCHVLAVCQPAVPVLAMTSLMSASEDPCAPLSMTLMGGPIDTRVNPTKVNELARTKPLDWFHKSVIARVPHYYLGAMRRVCPGFLMLSGFMSLNIERHIESNKLLFRHLVQGDEDGAESHRQFYDEYRSVLDLPADYFLDSVYHAFQNHSIPKGSFLWKAEKVDPKTIRKTALLTVEGEKDDISGVGQTYATHDLCSNIPQHLKKAHVEPGVGHYGVFNGRRWRENIAPLIRDFIQMVENSSPIQGPFSLSKRSIN